jgi:hypothetical protein
MGKSKTPQTGSVPACEVRISKDRSNDLQQLYCSHSDIILPVRWCL